jgi:8-oxo-dGTP pyrophosphatase MutT (NUDIX family)
MTNTDTGPVEGFVRGSTTTLHDWAAWSLVKGDFLDPSGEPFSRSFVVSPGAVGIVAVRAGTDQRVVFVRQYRPALHRMTLEVPAGMRDLEGEDPVITAQRELREEVGLVAEKWQHLGRHVSSPGISTSTVELFLATELSDVEHDRHGPEERHMTIEEHPLAYALGMVTDGRIDDSKTMIGLLLAERLLRAG